MLAKGRRHEMNSCTARVLVLALLASCAAASAAATTGPATSPVRTRALTGQVTALDEGSITVQPARKPGARRAPEAQTFTVDDKTRVHIGVEKDGTIEPQPAKKSDLKKGQTVLVRGRDGIATSIVILSQPEKEKDADHDAPGDSSDGGAASRP
jgi:hypothetical protein